MTDLESRVRSILAEGHRDSGSLLARLMTVYEADRETFFELATDTAGRTSRTSIAALSELATQIRKAIAATYRINLDTAPPVIQSPEIPDIQIPDGLETRVARFLREIDGKTVAERSGRDYEGTAIGDAELIFKLGLPSGWGQDSTFNLAAAQREPAVLAIPPLDLGSLQHQPAYALHTLYGCATKTVLAPTSVFYGLKRRILGGRELDGKAYCGKPRRSFDNEGNRIAPPQGMVFVVFADCDGQVFDWDWTPESRQEPGNPAKWDARFIQKAANPPDTTLLLPEKPKAGVFDPNVATYSPTGDCVFCYFNDKLSYSDRINPDLTVFRDFGSGTINGFKIKNIEYIIDRGFIDTESRAEILVSVRTILLATLQSNSEGRVDAQGIATTQAETYDIIIEALMPKPPAVQVRRRAAAIRANHA